MRLSRYALFGKPLTLSAGRVNPIMSTTTGRLVLVSDDDVENLTQGKLESLEVDVIQGLKEAGIVVEVDQAVELGDVVSENKASSLGPVLDEVIMPTRNCQLGCGYCGQVHRPEFLSISEQDALLARIERKLSQRKLSGHPVRTLRVGWFGAEPLLAMPVIRRLSQGLTRIARSSSCTISAHVVTNGFGLNAAVAAELAEVHSVERIEVTLDGLQPTHDLRRPTKSGRGSFDQIVSGLVESHAAMIPGLAFSVRCNVDRHNAAEIPALLDYLSERGLRGIKIGFSPVYDWGNDAGSEALNPEVYAELETGWLLQAHRLGFAVSFLPTRRSMVCVAVHPDADVTDAAGTTHSCTELPYVPAYESGGSSTEVSVGIGRSETARPFRGFVDAVETGKQADCNTCAAYPVCGGACPKAWADGRVPCPSFKVGYRDRIAVVAASRIRSATIGETALL